MSHGDTWDAVLDEAQREHRAAASRRPGPTVWGSRERATLAVLDGLPRPEVM